jgi:hypothetical protein
VLLAVVAPRAGAQQQSVPPDQPQPWTGAMGVTETVAQIMERERLNPDDTHQNKPKRIYPDRSVLPQDPNSPAVPRWPFDGNWDPPVGTGFPSLVERHVGAEDQESPQTPSTQFTAANLGASGFIPPDTMGDVSPTQVLTFANGRIRVYDKNGVLGGLNATANTFFTSVRNGAGVSDPVVIWDKLTSRWFVCAISTATPNRVLLAVSSGATITSTASFTFFFFQHDTVGTTPNADTGGFSDYVSMGVDANAVYMGGNIFNPSFIGCTGYVVRKSSITGAGPIVVTAFRQIVAGGGAGPYSPRGVTNDDPAATEGYFIGPSNNVFGQLTVRRILTPGGTPTISGNLLVTVPSTVNPQTVPALGSTTNIDVVSDDRCFQARIFRNRSTGVRTLWTAHHIEVNASGVASTTGNRDAGRWYQLQNLTTTPALAQSGTMFDSTASAVHYIFPSVAMSGQGHMAIGVSSGGTTEWMGASVAGRLSGDAVGSTQARTVATAGAGAYSVVASDGRNRWGDYSSLVVDPLDDQSMWAFMEYADAANSWAVRVVKLLAPPPATPTTLTPNTIAQGATNVAMTLTGTSASGSAFYDTEPGLNRIQAVFSGTGLTVSSVTRNSDTSLSLVVSATAGATLGARNVTITNPDGQTAVGASLLTVTSGACVPASVTGHPSNQTVCSGTPSSFTVTAAGDAPITYQWRLNGVNVGGATSSTYSIASTTPANAGTYDCVVTNACGTATSNGAALTVNTAPAISAHPVPFTTCEGQNAIMSVTASGSPAPTYQWRRNGVNIGGATGSSYVIAVTVVADAGNYDCVVTNACGSVTSTSAAMTINVPPFVTTHPSPQTVCAGSGATFSVTATGSAPLSYEWRKNGVAIPGATASSYSIITAAPGDAGLYDCTVINLCGAVTSSAALLTVNTAPAFITHPAPVFTCEGTGATFGVVVSSPLPFSYQWRKAGVSIPGANSDTYSIPSVTTADAGPYDCVATNSCGVTISNAALLTVDTIPTATNPSSVTVCEGQPASFSISTTGVPPPSMQWRRNGVNIPGATSGTYTIGATVAADAGAYDCVVTNACGSVTTSAAALVVDTAPVFTTHPLDATACVGTGVTFTVAATGSPAPAYQWRFNGGAISGATSASYTITSVTTGDAGSYDCVASNTCATVISSTATLTVNAVCCDSIDFNNDGLAPDTADIDDFLSVFSGGPCSTDPVPGCNDLDFNNDGLSPDTADIDSLLSVFSGGPCL